MPCNSIMMICVPYVSIPGKAAEIPCIRLNKICVPVLIMFGKAFTNDCTRFKITCNPIWTTCGRYALMLSQIFRNVSELLYNLRNTAINATMATITSVTGLAIKDVLNNENAFRIVPIAAAPLVITFPTVPMIVRSVPATTKNPPTLTTICMMLSTVS